MQNNVGEKSIYAKQYICDQWKPKQVNMKIAKVSRELSYDCWGTQPSEQARAIYVCGILDRMMPGGSASPDAHNSRSDDGKGEFASEPTHEHAVWNL